MHQLPPKPVGLRVKVWRRLQQQGAIAIKNSVYALPLSDAAREDFQWLAREITENGGEATVCAAQLVEGLTDAQVCQGRGPFERGPQGLRGLIDDAVKELEVQRRRSAGHGFE